jgi:hypothetical protein
LRRHAWFGFDAASDRDGGGSQRFDGAVALTGQRRAAAGRSGRTARFGAEPDAADLS